MTIVASPRLQQDVFSWEELSELEAAEPLFEVVEGPTSPEMRGVAVDPVAFDDDEEFEDEDGEEEYEDDEEDEEYEDEDFEDEEEEGDEEG